MKKRILPAVITCLCVLALAALAESPGLPVNINRIQVLPGTLAAKLVLETDGPLAAPKACLLYTSPSPRDCS